MEQKEIKNFNDYIINTDGEVWSKLSCKFLKQSILINGYLQVTLYNNDTQISKQIHRLVAETFIENPENKPQVNHINGIKDDNRIENLEWNTSSENLFHAHRTGLKKGSEFQKTRVRETMSKKVIDTVTGEIYDSVKMAAERNNINSVTLCGYLIGSRKNKTNLKYL